MSIVFNSKRRVPASRMLDARDASIYSSGIINMYCRARSTPATAARMRGMSIKQFIDAKQLAKTVRVYRDVTIQVDVPDMIDIRDETRGHYRFTLATQSSRWYRDFIADVNEVIPLHADFSITYVDPHTNETTHMHEVRPFDILFDSERRAVLSVGSEAAPLLKVRKKPKKTRAQLAARRAAQAAASEAVERPAIDERTTREAYNSAAEAAIDDVVRELLKMGLAEQAALISPKTGSVALRTIVLRNFGSAEHYPSLGDDAAGKPSIAASQDTIFSAKRPSVATTASESSSRTISDHLSPSAERFWKAVGFMSVATDIADLVTKFTKSLRSCCYDAIKRDNQQWLVNPRTVRKQFRRALCTAKRDLSEGDESTAAYHGHAIKSLIDEKCARVHNLRNRAAAAAATTNVEQRSVTYDDNGSYTVEEERRHVDATGKTFIARHREYHAAAAPEKASAKSAALASGESDEDVDKATAARLRQPRQLSVEGSDEELVNIDDSGSSSSGDDDDEVDEFGRRCRRRDRSCRRRRAHSGGCGPCASQTMTVVDRVSQIVRQTRGELSVLVQLLSDAGLIETLNTAKNITVFAPVNEAFASVDTKEFSKEDVARILKFHVVTEPIGDVSDAKSPEEAAQIVEAALIDLSEAGAKVTTAADGAKLSIETASRDQFEEATLVLNGQEVTLRSDPVLADNGTIWVIDTVLVPKGAAPAAAAPAQPPSVVATRPTPAPARPAPARPAPVNGDDDDDDEEDEDEEEFAFAAGARRPAARGTASMFAAPSSSEKEMLATSSRFFDRPPRLVAADTGALGGRGESAGDSATLSAGKSFADYATASIAGEIPEMPPLRKIPATHIDARVEDDDDEVPAMPALRKIKGAVDDVATPAMPALRKIDYGAAAAATLGADDETVVAKPEAAAEMPALKPLKTTAAAKSAASGGKSFSELLAERKGAATAAATRELSDSADDYMNFLHHFDDYMAAHGDAEHMQGGAIVLPPTSDVYSSQLFTALSDKLDAKQMRKNIEQYIVLVPPGKKLKITFGDNGQCVLRTMGGHEIVITKEASGIKRLSNKANTELLKARQSKTHKNVFFLPQRNLFKPNEAVRA